MSRDAPTARLGRGASIVSDGSWDNDSGPQPPGRAIRSDFERKRGASKPPSDSGGSTREGGVTIGDVVEAYWEEDKAWYDASVLTIHGGFGVKDADKKYDVLWEDGGCMSMALPAAYVRRRRRLPSVPPSAGSGSLTTSFATAPGQAEAAAAAGDLPPPPPPSKPEEPPMPSVAFSSGSDAVDNAFVSAVKTGTAVHVVELPPPPPPPAASSTPTTPTPDDGDAGSSAEEAWFRRQILEVYQRTGRAEEEGAMLLRKFEGRLEELYEDLLEEEAEASGGGGAEAALLDAYRRRMEDRTRRGSSALDSTKRRDSEERQSHLRNHEAATAPTPRSGASPLAAARSPCSPEGSRGGTKKRLRHTSRKSQQRGSQANANKSRASSTATAINGAAGGGEAADDDGQLPSSSSSGGDEDHGYSEDEEDDAAGGGGGAGADAAGDRHEGLSQSSRSPSGRAVLTPSRRYSMTLKSPKEHTRLLEAAEELQKTLEQDALAHLLPKASIYDSQPASSSEPRQRRGSAAGGGGGGGLPRQAGSSPCTDDLFVSAADIDRVWGETRPVLQQQQPPPPTEDGNGGGGGEGGGRGEGGGNSNSNSKEQVQELTRLQVREEIEEAMRVDREHDRRRGVRSEFRPAPTVAVSPSSSVAQQQQLAAAAAAAAAPPPPPAQQRVRPTVKTVALDASGSSRTASTASSPYSSPSGGGGSPHDVVAMLATSFWRERLRTLSAQHGGEEAAGWTRATAQELRVEYLKACDRFGVSVSRSANASPFGMEYTSAVVRHVSAGQWPEAVRAFFSEHHPAALRALVGVSAAYKGREQHLFAKVDAAYGYAYVQRFTSPPGSVQNLPVADSPPMVHFPPTAAVTRDESPELNPSRRESRAFSLSSAASRSSLPPVSPPRKAKQMSYIVTAVAAAVAGWSAAAAAAAAAAAGTASSEKGSGEALPRVGDWIVEGISEEKSLVDEDSAGEGGDNGDGSGCKGVAAPCSAPSSTTSSSLSLPFSPLSPSPSDPDISAVAIPEAALPCRRRSDGNDDEAEGREAFLQTTSSALYLGASGASERAPPQQQQQRARRTSALLREALAAGDEDTAVAVLSAGVGAQSDADAVSEELGGNGQLLALLGRFGAGGGEACIRRVDQLLGARGVSIGAAAALDRAKAVEAEAAARGAVLHEFAADRRLLRKVADGRRAALAKAGVLRDGLLAAEAAARDGLERESDVLLAGRLGVLRSFVLRDSDEAGRQIKLIEERRRLDDELQAIAGPYREMTHARSASDAQRRVRSREAAWAAAAPPPPPASTPPREPPGSLPPSAAACGDVFTRLYPYSDERMDAIVNGPHARASSLSPPPPPPPAVCAPRRCGGSGAAAAGAATASPPASPSRAAAHSRAGPHGRGIERVPQQRVPIKVPKPRLLPKGGVRQGAFSKPVGVVAVPPAKGTRLNP